MKIVSLHDFLDQKTMFYSKIEYDTIKKSWQLLEPLITLPYVIHIVGTNGKGTTGRFIATGLLAQNKTVLHYTSPHIHTFNERIWINGVNVSDEELEKTHEVVYRTLPQDLLARLTYFEYTTLLGLFLSDRLDYIVLEAGLGGEFDATNVVPNDITVVPTIGLDHQSFLGDTIEGIGTTKLRSCDKAYIFGKGIPKEIELLKKTILHDKIEIPYDDSLLFCSSYEYPAYLVANGKLALSVLAYLGLYRDDLVLTPLAGRCQKIAPNITIDVGHNPLAAEVIAQEFTGKKIILIYNTYKDKDFREILQILSPIIKGVMILPCEDPRIVDLETLGGVIKDLGIDRLPYVPKERLDPSQEYLVFGSFKVIEKFIPNKINNYHLNSTSCPL